METIGTTILTPELAIEDGDGGHRKAPEGTGQGNGNGKMKPRGKPFQRGQDARRKKGEASGNGSGGEMPPPFLTFTQHGAQAADMVIAAMLQQQQQQQQQQMQEMMQQPKTPETKITIKQKMPDGSSNETKTRVGGMVHKVFTEVLETLLAGLRNVMLVGPAGTGKTTLAKQIAIALQITAADHPIIRALASKHGTPFASLSCAGGVTESNFTGRLLPTGEGGRFEYHETPFVALLENGGLFLKDEVDGADANVLLVSNSAIDNGFIDIPNRAHDPVAIRADNSFLLLAANTFGLGANRQYVGRNQLDGAYLDRFAGAVIEMDYDKDLERGIVCQILPEAAATVWLEKAWLIRQSIQHTGLRRIWGMRALKHGAILQAAGMKEKAVLRRLTSGWSADEKEKAGIRA